MTGPFSGHHATGHSTPQIDSQQDYELISLQEDSGKTIMKFKRKFDTCDPDDNKVQVKRAKGRGGRGAILTKILYNYVSIENRKYFMD